MLRPFDFTNRTDGLQNSGVGTHNALNLRQFDSKTTQLYLAIVPAVIDQSSIINQMSEISCMVNVKILPDREFLFCFLFPTMVSETESVSVDTDFTDSTKRNLMPALIKKKNSCIRNRSTNRLIVTCFCDGCTNCGFCRSVTIIYTNAVIITKLVDQTFRENLSGGKNGFYVPDGC